MPGQKWPQRATFTAGNAAAELIPGSHNQGVELVVMLGQVATLHAAHARNRMARLGPLLQYLEQLRFGAADGALDQVSDLLVADLFADDSVPFQNAARISVHYEYRMISRIEQNGIGSFRSHAIQGQQLSAKLLCFLGEHAIQRAAVFFIQISDKGFQTLGFLPEVP